MLKMARLLSREAIKTLSVPQFCVSHASDCLLAARLCSEQESNCILISLELKNTILLNRMPNVNEILIRVSFAERAFGNLMALRREARAETRLCGGTKAVW